MLTLSLALFSSLSWADSCSDTRLHMSDQEYLDRAEESGDETSAEKTGSGRGYAEGESDDGSFQTLDLGKVNIEYRAVG